MLCLVMLYQKAMEELLELLEGKKAEGEIVFKNIVKWRESTR